MNISNTMTLGAEISYSQNIILKHIFSYQCSSNTYQSSVCFAMKKTGTDLIRKLLHSLFILRLYMPLKIFKEIDDWKCAFAISKFIESCMWCCDGKLEETTMISCLRLDCPHNFPEKKPIDNIFIIVAMIITKILTRWWSITSVYTSNSFNILDGWCDDKFSNNSPNNGSADTILTQISVIFLEADPLCVRLWECPAMSGLAAETITVTVIRSLTFHKGFMSS